MIDKYKFVIWDWNGTVLDDVELCHDLINWLLRSYNLNTISLEEYKNVFTIPVKNYYEKVGFNFKEESFEIIGKKWMDEYERRKYECGLFEGIENVFRKIQSMNIRQSVLSAYSQHTLQALIEYYKLTGYFSHIVGLDNIYAASKIAIGKNLIKKLGAKKGEAVMIGDTLHDYEVANEIGADCILLSCGHQSELKLKEGSGNKIKILPDAKSIL